MPSHSLSKFYLEVGSNLKPEFTSFEGCIPQRQFDRFGKDDDEDNDGGDDDYKVDGNDDNDTIGDSDEDDDDDDDNDDSDCISLL